MDEYTLLAVFTECPGDYPKKPIVIEGPLPVIAAALAELCRSPMIALSGLHQLTVKRA